MLFDGTLTNNFVLVTLHRFLVDFIVPLGGLTAVECDFAAVLCVECWWLLWFLVSKIELSLFSSGFTLFFPLR